MRGGVLRCLSPPSLGRRWRCGASVSDRGGDLTFARVALLNALRQRNYCFVTPTPLTHARVIARRSKASDLRDVLGWSMPFERSAIDAEIVELMEAADALEKVGNLLQVDRARVEP